MKQFYKFAALACMILCFTHASAQTETVLFTETFDTQESMEKFQTLDVDGDEESWTYNTVNECAQAMVPGFSAVNDWLITPAFDAKKGNTYLLQFHTEGNYGGVLEVAHGDQPTDECLSGNILIEKTTLDGNTWQQMETQFVCEADGPHYFAFHSVGAEWLSTLHVDNIVITEIATAPAEPENTLYGTIAYSDDAAAVMGIYSFNPQEEIELTPIATRTDYIANGGGVYVDGKYYFTCYMPYGSIVVCAYNIYDMELGTATSTINEGYQYVASDMAYDPTTGNVYCCSIDEIANGSISYVFSTMDLETGSKSAIADIMPMVVVAADKDGNIYGISSEGMLYRIDKWTGETSEIGDTGIRGLGSLVQSGTIDPETGIFYWAAATDNGSGLYEVDAETGAATLIGNFPHNEHMTGLFMTKDFFAEGTPAAVTDLKVAMNGGELNGTVAFTAPSLDNDGNTLQQPLTISIMIDGSQAYTESGVQPGEQVEAAVTLETDGYHFFTITASNDGGNGKPTSKRIYAGYDTPRPVTELTLEHLGNGEMHVTWNAPEGGINGGYIDYDNITYSIQRYPDYTWLTEDCTTNEWTDMLESTYRETYSYGIVATSHGNSSEMVVTNFVTVGEELAIPFLETFEVEPRFASWEVIDGNNDNCSWIYNYEDRAALYEWSYSEPQADDWLVSPKFTLESGVTYDFTIDARNSINGSPEKFEVFLGSAPDAESMTNEILPTTEINDNSAFQTITRSFTAPASGQYYLGIHVTSETHIGYLLVKNIGVSVSEGSGIEQEQQASSKAWSEGSKLYVSNMTDTEATIYMVRGIACGVAPAGETTSFDLPSGFYIVSFGDKAEKVIIK